MISVDIPKEIKQENKVVLMFTLRQFICVSAAGFLCFVIAVVFELEFSVSVYHSMVIGIVAFAFGWIKRDGLTMERLLMKYIQKAVYGNHVRLYRTKNRYIPLLNHVYASHKRIDERNRRAIRIAKKEKRKRKRDKSHRLKAIS